MKINFKKFDKKFKFCINDEILLFFGDEKKLNKKDINLKSVLGWVRKRLDSSSNIFPDEFLDGFLDNFLDDDFEIDITPEKIKDFVVKNKMSRVNVVEIIYYINDKIYYKLSNYFNCDDCGSAIARRLRLLPDDRFYNAIYQIILAQLEE